MSEPTVGVYVHVPFCERVCPYCDFAVVGGGLPASMEERYLAALERELDLRAADYGGRRLASLYLGGGTPSLLLPDSVARIAAAVGRHFPPSGPAVEVTLEVNPSTVERTRLPGFREAGVSRLSVGIQSFDDAVLRRLGRAHRAAEGKATLDAARAAGFTNVSIDLLYGAPGQGLAQLEADLRQAVEIAPTHVSAYELVVEEGTPFALADRRGQLARPDADAVADMLEALEAGLSAAGIEPYELTNFARPGFESVHNRRYWSREPVLGLGVGAWSSEPVREGAPYGSRSHNTRELRAYLARLEGGKPATEEREIQDAAMARAEAMFLALRCRTGLDAARFRSWFGAAPRDFFGAEIERLGADGLLDESARGDLRLTPRGRMLADWVASHFVAEPEEGSLR